LSELVAVRGHVFTQASNFDDCTEGLLRQKK
jgi:hypothetical protein